MENHAGMTLMEVLIALLLVSIAALAIFQNQWQSQKWFHRMVILNQALSALNNDTERRLCGCHRQDKLPAPFSLKTSRQGKDLCLQLFWEVPSHGEGTVIKQLHRFLRVE